MAHDEFLSKQKTPEQFLAHVIEEAGETVIALGVIVQAAAKTLRFGPEEVNPLLPKAQQERNIDWLLRVAPDVEKEFGDFKRALARFQSMIEMAEVAEHG